MKPGPELGAKPCPFCGSNRQIIRENLWFSYIRCEKCKTFGPLIEFHSTLPTSEEKIKQAVLAWNKRKGKSSC